MVPDAVASALRDAHERPQRELLEELATRNGRWFDLEMDKLDRWAEDRHASLKAARLEQRAKREVDWHICRRIAIFSTCFRDLSI